jgi:cell division protein FtsW (lipid II flippase)
MTRKTEGATIIAASVLAAFGVTLVNFANAGTLDAQSGLTFLIFAIAFGGLYLAASKWAPRSSSLLIAPVAALAAIGFLEIYRLDPARAGLQRWWLLIASATASLVLWLLSMGTVEILRRYRYTILLVSMILLLLPNLPQDWAFPLKGLEVNGSRLWIVLEVGNITALQFQPAELAKLGLVIFVAAYLADHQHALRQAHRKVGPFQFPEPRQLLPLLLTWGLSVVVLVSQRDLGASLLLFASFVLLLYATTGAS